MGHRGVWVFGVMVGLAAAAGPVMAAGVPLGRAVAAFNAKAAGYANGKGQSPLTEEEVVAAVRLAGRGDFVGAPDALFAKFKGIAGLRELPAGAEFEVLDSLDPGGDYVFDVWYVRVMMAKEDGGTYSFGIRNRVIRARPVGEVARELEEAMRGKEPMPGTYRIEDRVRDLKARAGKAAAAR